VAVNNIDVASEYIQKLRQELEGHAGQARPQQQQAPVKINQLCVQQSS